MDKKQAIKDFEYMLLLARARAYSNLSLQRPLSDNEYHSYKQTATDLFNFDTEQGETIKSYRDIMKKLRGKTK